MESMWFWLGGLGCQLAYRYSIAIYIAASLPLSSFALQFISHFPFSHYMTGWLASYASKYHVHPPGENTMYTPGRSTGWLAMRANTPPGLGGNTNQWLNFIWAPSLNVSFCSIQDGLKEYFEKYSNQWGGGHFHLKKISRHFWGVFSKKSLKWMP